MTVDEAIRWLTAAAARTCDALGNHGNARPWNSRDVEAVHVLQHHLASQEAGK